MKIMTTKDFPKRLEFDPDKTNDTYEKLVNIFKDQKLTTGEILIAYGNLGYTLGASIAGYKGTGPSIEELKKSYYENPTVGVALMLAAFEITNWYEDWSKQKIKQEDTKEKT